MIKMSEKSRLFIEKHFPDIHGIDQPNVILEPLYDLIMEEGFISYEEGYNDFGYEAQDVYDDIFFSNFD